MKNQILFFKFLSLAGLLAMPGYSFAFMQDQSQEILAQNQLLADEQIILDAELEKLTVQKTLQSKAVATEQLFSAAKNGDLKALKEALKAGADVHAKDAKGMTALIVAIEPMMHNPFANKAKINEVDVAHRITLVKELLNMGVDVNVQGYHGLTALMAAVGSDNVVITKELLHAGADVNAQGPMGTVLMLAIMLGNVALVKELLQAGADVNVQVPMGTALMFAASKGSVAMVTLLLQAGANVNARDDGGKTALTYAKQNNSDAVIQVLKQAGAKE